MCRHISTGVILGCLLTTWVAGRADDGDRTLAVSPVVVCRKVTGYRDYEMREVAELTRDEKLLLYFEPRDHGIREERGEFVAHLQQDVKIRPSGKKTVVWSKTRVLDYEARAKIRPERLYLMNTLAIKELEPGEYTVEITLRDLVTEQTAIQFVGFRVVKAEEPAKPESPKDEPKKPDAPRADGR